VLLGGRLDDGGLVLRDAIALWWTFGGTVARGVASCATCLVWGKTRAGVLCRVLILRARAQNAHEVEEPRLPMEHAR